VAPTYATLNPYLTLTNKPFPKVHLYQNTYNTTQIALAEQHVDQSPITSLKLPIKPQARLRTHNQNMTVSARAIAERNTVGDLS
jgi:hypothetical protein